jgi:NET1-associated nuclear protein 1 (U3 small nucleolar RNA-associated protein 17)
VTWYSLVQETSSNFNLVGVTESWGAVLFGDDVKSPSLEGTTATQITGDAYLPGRIPFCRISLEGPCWTMSRIPHLRQNPFSFVPRQGKQAVTPFFHAPAYLIPPLETVFDSIMQTFLTPRSTTESDEGHGQQAKKDGEEMDLDEDPVTEEAAPLIVKNTTRVADEREIHEFVELFNQYGLIGSCARNTFDRLSINKVDLQR